MGESAGHPFRGNQYAAGLSSGTTIRTTSPSGDAITGRVMFQNVGHSSGKPALQLSVEGRGSPMVVTHEHLEIKGFEVVPDRG